MNTLQVYDPFTSNGFDEIFRGLFKPVRAPRETAAAIKVDVTEKDGNYVVHAEIPGVRKDDIQVTIDGNQVTVSAEIKREAAESAAARPLRRERYFGDVYRSFVLPAEIDEAASTARYENGVLELTLTKKAQVAGRKLTIQ